MSELPEARISTRNLQEYILASLLHDIGRFRQRAIASEDNHFDIAADWLANHGLANTITELVKQHHQLDSVIYEAEQLLYDDKNIDEESLYYQPLTALFSRITDRDGEAPPAYYHPLTKLCDTPQYPRLEKNDLALAAYDNLWQEFEQEFKLINEDLDAERLLILLEKYTCSVPDCAEYPDVSLFDHTKMTTALVSCLLLADNEAEPFLLVLGDFSGVQKFVYTISSKGALKTLRGRSFFLELLTEHLVYDLLTGLGLSSANLLWSGGARFSLLLPNSSRTSELLDKVCRQVNRYLLREHDGKLYLALAWQVIDKAGFYEPQTRPVIDELGRKKRRKFEQFLRNDHFTDVLGPQQPTREECQVCHKDTDRAWQRKIGETDVQLCAFCSACLTLGQKLPSARFVSRGPRGLTFAGLQYGIEDARWLINDWDLGHYGPGDRQLLLARYGGEQDFMDMAKAAAGANDIGGLRMDVDSLGDLFDTWLRAIPAKPLLLYQSILSRELKYFFGYYLNSICMDKDVAIVYASGDDLFIAGAWNDIAELAFEIRAAFKEFTCHNPLVNISGGFVVQHPKYPLYHLAEAAHEAEQLAKENTGQNEKTKDSVALFYKSPVFAPDTGQQQRPKYAVKWDGAISANAIRTLKDTAVAALMKTNGTIDGQRKEYELKVPRGLFFKLGEVVEKKRLTGQLYLPQLSYVLTRFEQALQEEDKSGWQQFKKQLLRAETIHYLAPVLTWLEMLTRKESSDA